MKMIVVGSSLLIASWVVLLLMVIGQIPRHLLLSLVAYGISVAGLAVGIFGVFLYVRHRVP